MSFKPRKHRLEMDANGKVAFSVERLPQVDRALHCALPLLHVAPSMPEWPGIGASCFLVRYKGRLLGLTAWHVVKDSTVPDGVAIPTGLGGPIEYLRFSRAIGPRRLRESDRRTERDVEDVVVLSAEEGQTLRPDVQPFDFDSTSAADINKCRPGESILATHGYPQEGQAIEYDGGSIKTLAHIVPGIYVGPSVEPGLHEMKGDFSTYASGPFRAPLGMSGAPVVLCVPFGDPFDGATWRAGIAGMVVRGGESGIHFLDTLTLHVHVRQLVRRLEEEGL